MRYKQAAGALDACDAEAVPKPHEVSIDSLQLFLKNIAKVDLLTAAQDPDADARGREAEQDRPLGTEAAGRAQARADVGGNRQGPRADHGRGGADSPQRTDAGISGEAGRRRGRVGVRPLPKRREPGAARRGGGGDDAQGNAGEDLAHTLQPSAPGTAAPLRARRPAPAHARRGRSDVRCHARADSPDREPVAEEASRALGRSAAPRHGSLEDDPVGWSSDHATRSRTSPLSDASKFRFGGPRRSAALVCKSARNKKPRYARLLQSPLRDSNRRPPPYHAASATPRFADDCHRL